MDDGGRARVVIVPSDGSTLFSSVTDTPCRATMYLNDLMTARSCHSGSVYKITSAGSITRLGTVPGQDKVRIARNQKSTPQILYQVTTGVYIEENEIVAKLITDSLPVDAALIDVAVFDGYAVYIYDDGRFFLSELNQAFNIDPLDFATAESSPDGLVAGWVIGSYLLLFGTDTIEPWKNTGGDLFPLEPMPTVIPKGCAGKWTIASFDNGVTFLDHNGIYQKLSGFQPTRISNHEVERLIQSESDPSVIEAQSWSRAGHEFVELKGTNWSKVYDANTQQWHDRESYGQDTWRHNNAFTAWNKVIKGDRLSGNLYYDDAGVNTEAGGTQVAKMRFPTLNVFPKGGIVDAIHLDFLTGQGVTSPTAQGYDPLLMFRVSKDGGNTWPINRHLRTGKRGKYGRVTTRRLGKIGPEGAVIELSMSDPVGRALALADAQVRPLNI